MYVHTYMLIYIYKHIVVSLLYTDMVKLNPQTPQDSPYTLLQKFLITAGEFWEISRENSCLFCPDYILLAAPFMLLSVNSWNSSLFIPVIPLEVYF